MGIKYWFGLTVNLIMPILLLLFFFIIVVAIIFLVPAIVIKFILGLFQIKLSLFNALLMWMGILFLKSIWYLLWNAKIKKKR